jgi:DNA-binding FrmR family transcriptional regulator
MNKKIKKKILKRLSIIKGQVEGLGKMIENEKYCLDILIQASAIKNAISSIEREVLKNHLKTYVIEQIKNNKEKKSSRRINKNL